MSFMVDKVMRYRWLYSQESPIQTVELFVSLTYCLKTGFDCLTERDREEMFTYFEQWSLLKPVEFEMLIQDILSIEYDHNDIAGSLSGVRRFMDVMVLLFGKLSKLKFIGEQHDTGIVLGETIEPKKQEKKLEAGASWLIDRKTLTLIYGNAGSSSGDNAYLSNGHRGSATCGWSGHAAGCSCDRDDRRDACSYRRHYVYMHRSSRFYHDGFY
jgi:hypothetical protein